MGIHGLLKHLGSGKRQSLATLSAEHYVEHERPFRLAIDISIWLFQIQAGQGGSNPALRTFYYRLLRLISLNIHPLFVFDGPNKPLFKRNKRVGGPGVRVANVPEFLAKQLLKQFGFPIHVAPGEAEAECALLQRHGVVDAVLSEDVDTMMFGSRMTLRNWSAEVSSKTPTHVDIYQSSIVEQASGLDSDGMILVALMSGGDYIPEGIPKCGPKFAVDAAKAGFGKRLCALDNSDTAGLAAWREELRRELRTNASKYFTRKNTTLVVPDDFPDPEVFGYYTHPCVSSVEKVEQLRQTLLWDLALDLPALRAFTGDAFEWYNRGGAIKFIRNLAPALLIRQLRVVGERSDILDLTQRNESDSGILEGIHGSRTHASTDKVPEMRVSYVPGKLVPIDLCAEPLDDDEAADRQQEEDDESLVIDAGAAGADDDVPATPSRRKRTSRPYEEDSAERMWVLRDWIQLGCPLMLEDFEDAQIAKAQAQAQAQSQAQTRSKARAKKAGSGTGRYPAKQSNMPTDTLLRHVRVTKTISTRFDADVAKEGVHNRNHNLNPILSSSPSSSPRRNAGQANRNRPATQNAPRTPSRKKRGAVDILTPRTNRSAITDYFSPTPRRQALPTNEVISLLSSSPTRMPESRIGPSERPRTTTRAEESQQHAMREISDNIGYRQNRATLQPRQPRTTLQKSLSVPSSQVIHHTITPANATIDCLDLAESPARAHVFAQGSINTNVARPYPAERTTIRTMTTVNSTSDVFADAAAIDLSYGVAVELPKSLPKKGLRAPRAVAGISDTSVPDLLGAQREATLFHTAVSNNRSPQAKKKKTATGSLITLRQSLDGAWETSLDTLEPSARRAEPKRTKDRTWRVSAVDILDLTGD